jgi:hypothetical protein
LIVYTDSLDGITPDHLRGFFVGWPDPPTPQLHLDLLRGSAEIVLAVDTDAARVIGSELVRRMLDKLAPLYAVDLTCDARLQPFYARFGMQPYTGMIRRRYDRQAGREA